jgi:hypothetical protein
MPDFTVPLDASSKFGNVSLTTSEDTLNIRNPSSEKVTVWAQADVDWYLDTVSGAANAARILVVAKQCFPLVLDVSSISHFFIKGTGAGTMTLWQPE